MPPMVEHTSFSTLVAQMVLTAGRLSGGLFFDPTTTGGRSMITFTKKADPKPATEDSEQNRFETVRRAAADRRSKADSDGTLRRARQTAENNRLI